MGYGEYDGGGSVKWRVENTDGESAHGNGISKAHGRDKDPKNTDALMAVWINNQKLPTFLCEGAKVVVAWGADAEGPDPPKY